MNNQNQSLNENIYHLALILSKKISTGTNSGNDKLKSQLEEFGSFEEICRNQWGDLFGFEKNMFSEIPTLESKINILKKINFQIQTTTINDKQYPEYLKNIKGITPVLYSRGNLELLNQENSIGIVGSREPSQIALEEVTQVTKRLADKNYLIVSGLAQGIDTKAHRQALNQNLQTIAVLGTPLDKYSVKENKTLQDEIANNHLLISQYPIGTTTFPSHFAHRNSTTVALSNKGIIVGHAMDKSGTLNAIKSCVKNQKQLYILKNNLQNNCEWIEKYKEQIKLIK